jgi:hypothetical protein
MGTSAGPRQTTKGNLIFAIDSADFPNSAMPLGGGDTNGVTQGMRSNVNGLILQFTNGLKIEGRDYYTAFAIDYPEGNYGGDAANRQGITPGYNVRSGGKVYGFGRALHYAVWDRITEAWVLFETYDSYVGTGPVDNFVTRYNQMIADYPNAIHVVAGLHRDSYHTEAQYTILRDLGAPSNVDSIIGFSSPEWILVGKPRLRPGNAYGWAFQNYTTNPDQVAHLNFSIPRQGVRTRLEFDGSNDYLPLATNLQSGFAAASYEFVCNPYSLPGSGVVRQLYIQENSTWLALYNNGGTVAFGVDLNNGSGWFDNNGGFNTGARTTATITANQYYHVMYTWEGAVVKVYLNGVLQSTTSTLQAANGRQNVTTLGGGTTHRNIGSRSSGAGDNWYGTIDVVNFYNRGLSATEVTEQYNNYRKRFPFDVAIGTQANPATSATAIQTANPDAQDGVYWLTIGGSTFQAPVMFHTGKAMICVMKGGGGNGFPPDDALWENNSTQNTSDFDLTNSVASKYASYHTVPLSEFYFKLGATNYPVAFRLATAASSMLVAQQRSWNDSANRSTPHYGMNQDYRTVAGADAGITATLGTEIYMYGMDLKHEGHYGGGAGNSGGRIRVGSILDESTTNTGGLNYGTAGSAFGIGVNGGNPLKTAVAGYAGWSESTVYASTAQWSLWVVN